MLVAAQYLTAHLHPDGMSDMHCRRCFELSAANFLSCAFYTEEHG